LVAATVRLQCAVGEYAAGDVVGNVGPRAPSGRAAERYDLQVLQISSLQAQLTTRRADNVIEIPVLEWSKRSVSSLDTDLCKQSMIGKPLIAFHAPCAL
jgi:hypothetical protein